MGRLKKSTTLNLNYMSTSERKSKIEAWESISWDLLEYRVHRVQRRIYKASFLGNQKQLFWLQNKLIRSPDAQLLAVRIVTTLYKNIFVHTFGKVSELTGEQKLQMSRNLHLDGKAISNLQLFMPSTTHIQTRVFDLVFLIDKAKQVLAKFVLEPEWEARFEDSSYGARSGRSAHDAIDEVFLCMQSRSLKWIGEYNLNTCLTKLQPAFIIQKLNTFSQMNKQLQAWLNSGILREYFSSVDFNENIPTLAELAHNDVLATLLINVLLYDLENYLSNLFCITSNCSKNRGDKLTLLTSIRYIGKFILINENEGEMKVCMAETSKWLLLNGIPLSSENFRLRKGSEGFTFLGFQVIQIKKLNSYKVKIIPSRTARIQLLLRVRDILQKNKSASAFNLICCLRPVILGWAKYFRHCECKEVFDKLSYQLFGQLRAWVFRRDTRNGRSIVKERYFPSSNIYLYEGNLHKDRWVLFGTKKDLNGKLLTTHLPKISWVRRVPYIKIKSNYSPYNGDHLYWSKRHCNYRGLPIILQKLLMKQKHLCVRCKEPFLTSAEFEIRHIISIQVGYTTELSNLQVVHRNCCTNRTMIKIPQNNKP